nr:synaptobrevin, longin-like domain protein [Tanacetum cinerariifolium]
LVFYDYHNMIAILEKYEHNVDFYQIVDFIEASHIRRNLKLNDEAGISSLPDAELFENLALMGYNILPNQKFSFQKGQFSHQWKYLIHTIMQCLTPKSTGFNEFSSNIATAVVSLATNRVYNFSKMIFDGMVRNVKNKVSKFLMYPRVNSPSFSGRTVPLFDSMLVHQGEGSGTPTDLHHTPSPEAQQSSPTAPLSSSLPPTTTKTIPTVIPTDIPTLRQYSRIARIAQSLTLPTAADEPASPFGYNSQASPHDSPPRVLSLVADAGSMQHKLHELTDLCTRLQRQQTEMAFKIAAQDLEITSLKAKIKLLKDKDKGGAESSGEDATIKGRSLETKEEAGVEKSTKRGSND